MKNWKHGSAILNSCVGLCIIQVREPSQGHFISVFVLLLQLFCVPFSRTIIFFFFVYVFETLVHPVHADPVPSFYSPKPFSPVYPPFDYFYRQYYIFTRSPFLIGCAAWLLFLAAVGSGVCHGFVIFEKINTIFRTGDVRSTQIFSERENLITKTCGEKKSSGRHKFFFTLRRCWVTGVWTVHPANRFSGSRGDRGELVDDIWIFAPKLRPSL